MTFNYFDSKGLIKELRRLNDNLEMIMIHSLGLAPKSSVPKAAKPQSEDIDVSYTDEAQDFEREFEEKRQSLGFDSEELASVRGVRGRGV